METDIYEIIGKEFRNEITSDEKMYLEQWLKLEGNRQIFHEVEKVWKHTGSLEFYIKPDVDMEWGRFNKLKVDPSTLSYLEEKKTPKLRALRNWGLKVAAVFFIGLISFISIKLLKPTTEIANLITVSATDMVKEVTLPDGSILTLNKATTIQYPEKFKGKYRQVSLNGEAFFDVAKGKGTFTVITDKTTITVLGTKFNVKANSSNENTELFVTDGKVKFAAIETSANEIFESGEQGIINNNTGKLTPQININLNKIAWITGDLIFNNCLMDEVQYTLNNYFGKSIVLEEQIKDLRFTGSFSKPQLNELLEVISVSLAVNCIERNDSIFICRP